jgi:uncharacterized heparinase superfamily protein
MTAPDTRSPSPGDIRRARRNDRPALLSRLRHDALLTVAAGPFYRHLLSLGHVPADVRLKIAQHWPGDPKRGAAILAGEVEFAGERVRNPSPTWFPPGAGAQWLAAWHGFDWLADLYAAGGKGREAAREAVRGWIAENTGWHRIAWRADVLASRLFAWLAYLDEIAGRDADAALRRALLQSLAAQLRHLSRTAAWEVAGAARLRAAKGLIAGAAAFGSSAGRSHRALKLLERELLIQILPDGGHISRSPSVQLQVLQDLIDTRAVLRTAHSEVPAALEDAIGRMAPMLRFFRHGDLRLALFNDSFEEDGVLIDLVLTRSEARGRAPSHAPDSGFSRLQAGGSLVLADTGRPPPPGFDEHAHAGTLSFEMGHGRERIIVNCGAYRGSNANWRRVARASAAHSVLVVGDTNAIEIRDDGALGRSPTSVACERAEEDGRHWVLASHDGYRQRFGLTYSRQLYLAADGADLRGEDKLGGRPGANFVVRFHLHPLVQASLVADGSAVLLRLPSGTLWRLRAAGAEIGLGESVYLGSGEARKTQQVMLTGTVEPQGTAVRWAIRREARAAPPEMPADEPPAADG